MPSDTDMEHHVFAHPSPSFSILSLMQKELLYKDFVEMIV